MLVKQRKVILTILYLFSRYSNQVLELKNCIMGFSGLLRRNSSRRRSFKRIEPRDRAAQSTNSGAQHTDSDSANRENRTSREIGSMLRKIGDELNNSRLSLNSLI